MGQDEKLREEEQKNYERIVERLQKEKEWILEQTNGQRLVLCQDLAQNKMRNFSL